MLRAFARRLRAKGAASTMTYSLGRFSTVRRGYGVGVSALQRAGAVPGLKAVGGRSMFEGETLDRIVKDMGRYSAAFDLQLPAEIVALLAALAEAGPLRDWVTQRVVTPEAIVDGKLSDGSPVFLADVVDVDLNPAAIRVARDSMLLDAVTRYMGYSPVGVDIRMLRSFVVEAPLEQRRKYQTVDYHFDVHSYNFVYANFYISEVDAASGAHEMVLGSHSDKPVAWLLGSARRTDEEILAHYGSDRVRTITGPAGAGFLQDSSCYHRALAPSQKERVMLHLRYY